MTNYLDAVNSNSIVLSDQLHGALVKAREQGVALAIMLLDPFITREMVTSRVVNYLDASEGGKLSYLPASRREKRGYTTAEDLMTGPGRQEATTGRVLRKLLTADALGDGVTVRYLRDPSQHVTPKPRVTDQDIEQLAVFLQAQFLPLDPFIVTGEAIRYWYFEENYTQQEHGTLLKESCMRYAQNWNDIRFYAQNPAVIGLLCALDSEGKLKARALLWNTQNGILMDRVYGSDQSGAAFRRFARERGWNYRKSDMTDDRSLSCRGSVIIPLQHLSMRQKPPFLDTFGLVPFRASGDRGAARDHAGRLVGYEDCDQDWMTGPNNPIDYAAVILKDVSIPRDHPLKRAARGHHVRDDIHIRDQRVDWLSDFSWVPPWPDDLVRAHPEWTLERWGSDPEDDAANLARFPPRRTQALVIDPPQKEEMERGSSMLLDGIDAEAFRHNVRVIDRLFAQRQDATDAPLITWPPAAGDFAPWDGPGATIDFTANPLVTFGIHDHEEFLNDEDDDDL